MISPSLQAFYREVQAWVDEGCPDRVDLMSVVGLCGNLSNWLAKQGLPNDAIDLIYQEQSRLFEAAGLAPDYPFNEDDCDYDLEINKYRQPARLAWIKEHAQ